MTNPRVAIDITANDRSGKGVASAEKRIGTIPKHAGVANRRMLEDGERSVGRSSRGILRTLGSVEQATAKVFGGRSITSGLSSRISGLGEVASTTGGELRAAAGAGGLLEGAAAGIGVAVGATVGILAAAGYAAFKLADGWAKGAASIGRTAETIGVGTKAMQEFTAAGERVGVDKSASAGTLGSLSQTLNDAHYGRNAAALAILGRLGVGMKTKADGTADVEAMLPAIADGIARANSSGQRTAAKGLGIGLDSLPMFRQGGKALSADMADADTHAVVIDQGGIETGKRIARKGAMVGQLTDLAMSRAGEATATVAEGGYDAVLKGGTALADGATSFGGIVKQTFAPAAERIERAANLMFRAAGGVGRLSEKQVAAKARQGMAISDKLVALGASRNVANAMAANAVMESGGDYRKREKGGHGYGLFQITDRARRAIFQRTMGVDIEHSSEDQQLKFALWELKNSEASGWRKAQRNGTGDGSLAAGYARFVERPANKDRDSEERRAVATAMETATPVHVTVELKNAPQGTRASVRAGRGSKPAVSHAMSMGPAGYSHGHGG